MIKICGILKYLYGIDTSDKHDELNGDNGLIKVRVEPPCSNPDCRDEQKKWLLRMAPSASFDRWSVATGVCERFDKIEHIVTYLSNTTEVYKALFKAVSQDYIALSKENERLQYHHDDDATSDYSDASPADVAESWIYETGNGCWSAHGFSATNWVNVYFEDAAFATQKANGYNYVMRHQGNRNDIGAREFWNCHSNQWINGTTFID